MPRVACCTRTGQELARAVYQGIEWPTGPFYLTMARPPCCTCTLTAPFHRFLAWIAFQSLESLCPASLPGPVLLTTTTAEVLAAGGVFLCWYPLMFSSSTPR